MMSMKKLIICLAILSSSSFTLAQYAPAPAAHPDQCKGDTACQYRSQAHLEKREKQKAEEKAQSYREDLLETQKAQLQQTQEQNRLLEDQIEQREEEKIDRQIEREENSYGDEPVNS